MKKNLILTLIVFFALPTISNAQGKWFLSGTVNANMVSVEGETAFSAGVGLGIHRMLGDRFSLGVDLFYTGADDIHALEADMVFAYYGRLADKFYYVPELSAGVGYFFVDAVTFGAGFSPFGLEFRPTRRLGFRVNILNISYVYFGGSNIFNLGINPALSVNFRF